MSSGFDPVPSDRLEITNERGSALTDFDYRVAASILKLTHSLQLPKDTLSYLVETLALNQPQIPVSQLSGFTTFNPLSAPFVGDGESTTSTTFTDLGTAGPTLTAVPDGTYLLLFGALIKVSGAGNFAYMGVKLNTTEAVDADSVQTTNVQFTHCSFAVKKTLSNAGNNTILARYHTDAATTATFGNRWLIAIKTSEI